MCCVMIQNLGIVHKKELFFPLWFSFLGISSSVGFSLWCPDVRLPKRCLRRNNVLVAFSLPSSLLANGSTMSGGVKWRPTSKLPPGGKPPPPPPTSPLDNISSCQLLLAFFSRSLVDNRGVKFLCFFSLPQAFGLQMSGKSATNLVNCF